MLLRSEASITDEWNEMEAFNLLYSLSIDPNMDCEVSETINQVSSYIYYSLDEWGRQNTENPAPQCLS